MYKDDGKSEVFVTATVKEGKIGINVILDADRLVENGAEKLKIPLSGLVAAGVKKSLASVEIQKQVSFDFIKEEEA